MSSPKLVGTSTSGDQILASQKLAADEGFKNVSKLWYNKTTSYEAGLEFLQHEHDNSEDFSATVADFSPDIEGDSVVFRRQDGRVYRPTEYAYNQIGVKTGVGGRILNRLTTHMTNKYEDIVYKRDRQDLEVVRDILKNELRRLDQEKEYFWRVNNERGTLRAMLTDKYGVVDNVWFIQALRQIVPGGRLSHWKRSDGETIWGNVLIPDTIREESDSDYGGMLSVSNSQIGERKLTSIPSVFRAICMNGCIWGQTKGTEFNIRHFGNIDLEDIFLKLQASITEQIPLLPQGIAKLINTKSFGWDGASALPMFAEFNSQYKFGNKFIRQAVENFANKEQSLFGLIDAVTRTGQTEGFSNEDWYRADNVAGSLVNMDKEEWGKFTKRAKSLSVKRVNELVGVSN